MGQQLRDRIGENATSGLEVGVERPLEFHGHEIFRALAENRERAAEAGLSVKAGSGSGLAGNAGPVVGGKEKQLGDGEVGALDDELFEAVEVGEPRLDLRFERGVAARGGRTRGGEAGVDLRLDDGEAAGGGDVFGARSIEVGEESSGASLELSELGALAVNHGHFVEARAGGDDKGGGDEGFLEGRHENGFDRSGGGGGRDGEGGGAGGDRTGERDGSCEDRVGGEVGGQSGSSDGEAAAQEDGAQLVEGAAHALLRGVFAGAEGLADFAEAFVFEKPEEDRGAVGLGEGGDGFVEEGFELRPRGGRRGRHGSGGGEFDGGLFAGGAASLAADHIDGGAAGDDVEPGGERLDGGEFLRVAGEVEEDGLRDVFGELGRADLAAGGGVDEVDVAGDEFGEGGLRIFAGVAGEQFVVGHGVSAESLSPPDEEIRQRNVPWGEKSAGGGCGGGRGEAGNHRGTEKRETIARSGCLRISVPPCLCSKEQ